MCRKGAAVKGEGGGHELSPVSSGPWRHAASIRGASAEQLAGEKEGPALCTALDRCHPGVPPACCAGCRHPPPATVFPSPSHSVSRSASSVLAMGLEWGQWGSQHCYGGAGAMLGTRGTLWHVPGKDKCCEASFLRSHGSGRGHTAWAADLAVIFLPLPFVVFLPSPIWCPGKSGQWRAVAGSGHRGQAKKPSVASGAHPGRTWHPLLGGWVLASLVHAGALLRMRRFYRLAFICPISKNG